VDRLEFDWSEKQAKQTSVLLLATTFLSRGRKGDADLYLEVHVWEFRDGKISRLAGFKREQQSMNRR